VQKLPKKLGREPLIDALFEVRLAGTPQLGEVLLGFLFHELDPKPTLQRLPAADIPQPMREMDPNLKFAPVSRLEWNDYFIATGDRSIVISCKLPYPGWTKFKAAILDITKRIAKVGFAGSVERFSLKYVNLIEAPTLAEQISKIIMSITLGPIKVADDHVNLQVHHKEKEIVHILSVLVGATANLPSGKQIVGVVVDVDSIHALNMPSFEEFSSSLEPALEELRQENKKKFFGCLTEKSILEMEPIYE